MINPYAAPKETDSSRACGDHARLVQSAFLFRVIEFDKPFVGRLKYSSWWWRQRIDINGYNVWFRISWVRIHKRAKFRIPVALDHRHPEAEIEIEFSRSAAIRRFRFWIDGQIVYDEVN